jgi:Ca2+-binding EF-hand superfamily protein
MSRLLGATFLFAAMILMVGSADAQQPKKGTVDVDGVFKKLDANGDAKLQKEEFLRLAEHFKDKGKAREKLTSAFTTMDAEKKGFLSKDQLRGYFDAAKKRVENP